MVSQVRKAGMSPFPLLPMKEEKVMPPPTLHQGTQVQGKNSGFRRLSKEGLSLMPRRMLVEPQKFVGSLVSPQDRSSGSTLSLAPRFWNRDATPNACPENHKAVWGSGCSGLQRQRCREHMGVTSFSSFGVTTGPLASSEDVPPPGV